MEIKTHLESHQIKIACCVCGLGYALSIDECQPTSHDAYRNGKYLGTVCDACMEAGEGWIRAMLGLSIDEPITHIIRPEYLDILTGHYESDDDNDPGHTEI